MLNLWVQPYEAHETGIVNWRAGSMCCLMIQLIEVNWPLTLVKTFMPFTVPSDQLQFKRSVPSLPIFTLRVAVVVEATQEKLSNRLLGLQLLLSPYYGWVCYYLNHTLIITNVIIIIVIILIRNNEVKSAGYEK